MSCISNLAPPSVTTLKLEYTILEERGWRDFFMSHPGVRAIECAEFFRMPISRTLWNALSPTGGEDASVPCPGLESISMIGWYAADPSFTALSDCLRGRQTAGFKLRHLKMIDYNGFLAYVEGVRDEFSPLVEVVEVGEDGFRRMVRSLSICIQTCADRSLVG